MRRLWCYGITICGMGMGIRRGYRRWLMDGKELVALAEAHDGCGIREKLGEMVPDYVAGDSDCVI